MAKKDEFKEIAYPRFKYMLTTLIDTAFLGLWIGAQWGVNALIKKVSFRGD